MTKPYVYSGFSEKTSAKFSNLVDELQYHIFPSTERIRAMHDIIGKERKILGCGFYAVTFEYGKTQVLKTNIGAWDIQDDAQAEWLQWCSLNQDLDWVPRIDYLYVDWNSNEYFAIMEKLNGVYSLIKKKSTKELLTDEIDEYAGLICEYLLANDKESELEVTQQAFKQNKKFKTYGVDLPFYEAFFADGSGKAIRNELQRMGKQYYVDLHTDNFMIRNSGKNQAIVITDPINNY